MVIFYYSAKSAGISIQMIGESKEYVTISRVWGVVILLILMVGEELELLQL